MYRNCCKTLSLDIKYWQDKKNEEPYIATKFMELRRNIAYRYLFMARMLHCHPVIIRECILIAFLFYSSKEHYDLLLIIARQFYPHLRINDNGVTTLTLDNGSSENVIITSTILKHLVVENIHQHAKFRFEL